MWFSILRERSNLAEDIKAKQELIQQRQVEVEGLQEGVDQVTKQREALEKEREETKALLDKINTDVRRGVVRGAWVMNIIIQKVKYEGQIAELKQNCDDEREEVCVYECVAF